MDPQAIELIQAKLNQSLVLYNEPMEFHTSFKTGGPADVFIEIANINELIDVLTVCRQLKTPYYIMGNGSNLLVKDLGYRGVIIKIGSRLSNISRDGDTIIAQSGALLSDVAAFALRHQLTGLEFAEGIPGALGGAICMNAGAYDGEFKNIVSEATVLTPDCKTLRLSNESLRFGYRTSQIQSASYIVLEGKLQLSPGHGSAIQAKMAEYHTARYDKQPMDMPSAGSTFRRPTGHFVGKLITDAGLRGYRLGGAQISEKHAGFIVNSGGATSSDILNLIHHIQKTIKQLYNVQLETEVKIIGE